MILFGTLLHDAFIPDFILVLNLILLALELILLTLQEFFVVLCSLLIYFFLGFSLATVCRCVSCLSSSLSSLSLHVLQKLFNHLFSLLLLGSSLNFASWIKCLHQRCLGRCNNLLCCISLRLRHRLLLLLWLFLLWLLCGLLLLRSGRGGWSCWSSRSSWSSLWLWLCLWLHLSWLRLLNQCLIRSLWLWLLLRLCLLLILLLSIRRFV